MILSETTQDIPAAAPDLRQICAEGDWTLFLDRDGVINVRIVDEYVRDWPQFRFAENVPSALAIFARCFRRIIVVTNQQGIGKGLMTEYDLGVVHGRMISAIENSGGRVDAVLYCPHMAKDGCGCRKPAPGMARRAVELFPDIDLSKSIMAGDSVSDMTFAENSGMTRVWIGAGPLPDESCDLRFASLWNFAEEIVRCSKR